MPKWVKDDIESVRKLLTHPNWAMLKLLSDGRPRTKKEIYAELGKKFTRKTLIISLHTLSVELGALKPVIVPGRAGHDMAYTLTDASRNVVATVLKLAKR